MHTTEVALWGYKLLLCGDVIIRRIASLVSRPHYPVAWERFIALRMLKEPPPPMGLSQVNNNYIELQAGMVVTERCLWTLLIIYRYILNNFVES